MLGSSSQRAIEQCKHKHYAEDEPGYLHWFWHPGYLLSALSIWGQFRSKSTHGSGIFGSYGYLPSLANCSDDPTRDVPLRGPVREVPNWLHEALLGNFEQLDAWLKQLGYDPATVAGLPVQVDSQDPDVIKTDLLGPLSRVQKPERMRRFEEKEEKPSKHVSPPCVKDSKELVRGQESDPLGQTKNVEKRPKRFEEGRRPIHSKAVVSEKQVAPPAVTSSQGSEVLVAGFPPVVVGNPPEVREDLGVFSGDPKTFSSSEPKQKLTHKLLRTGARRAKRQRCKFEENPESPLLDSAGLALLQKLPSSQFFVNGTRAPPDFVPKRKGFLDLYTGKGGVAKFVSKNYGVWVLSFEIDHHPSEDLLLESTRQLVLDLLDADVFLGAGMAPECSSFSRAVTPAVRSRDEPAGLKNISLNMQRKVAVGNSHAQFVLVVLERCRSLHIIYWCENPDSSFLFLQKAWLASGISLPHRCYRFDMCRYATPWRKRTRIVTNTELAGVRELCLRDHQHLALRGRSSAHQLSWTRVAQTYPTRLCARIGTAMCRASGLKKFSQKFKLADMAKCSSNCIGEASHPGPARPVPRERRDVGELERVVLIEAGTHKIQQRVWEALQLWIADKFSYDTASQVFICPILAVQVLRTFGIHHYSHGGPMYELRHLYVTAQQRFPLLKPMMSPCWDLINRWEEVRPTKHRMPLPELLFRSLITVAVNWKWKRWAATLLLGYEGIARIGEVLAARRSDLVLPCDMFEEGRPMLFMKVRKPKSHRRGKGRVQHIKVENEEAVRAISSVFQDLDGFLPLFPLSTGAFRTRWEKIMDFLHIPKSHRPTPSSIRGGGAILAYRRGEQISSILWRMRLVAQTTLESYLQEVAAESFLISLPHDTKGRIRFLSSLYPSALKSLG